MLLKDFNSLKKNLKKDTSAFQKVKIALLGDSATQFLNTAIRGYGIEMNYNFDMFEADYSQIQMQILDPNSELYSHEAQFVVIYMSTEKLMSDFYKSQRRDRFAEAQIHKIESYCDTLLLNNPKTRIIFYNFIENNDSVFGHFSNKVASSFGYQVRKLNYELMNLAGRFKNFFLLDLNALCLHNPSVVPRDNKMYMTADLTIGLEFLPIVARGTVQVIASIVGHFKKALILDLDNTTWGGIIGDDGIENIQVGHLGLGKAFSELQQWAKELKQRGIILAVCSKNQEQIAQEPFQKHPDMVLKLEDIAVFVANWESKVDNIRYIQSVLNIGFDSMVFLDDNPFERNVVRTHIPQIEVPELPEDPAEYMTFLRSLNLFETASYTEEDSQRTKQYQEEAGRVSLQKTFTDEKDFLRSLEMVAHIEGFTDFNTPRVSQLTQRSNQFNLRTVRYTEEDIKRIKNDKSFIPLAISLEDKFGDYGLISVLILKREEKSIFIDTWIMSCRVLKREVESLVLNKVVSAAKSLGCNLIVGEYLPTSKNGLVKDHFEKLGFISKDNVWVLESEGYQQKNHAIAVKEM